MPEVETSRLTAADQNHRTIAALERYNETLYMDLEREKRAIQNWQRLKILLAVLKVCGGRMDKADEIIAKEANKSKTLDDWMMPLIRSPDNIKA